MTWLARHAKPVLAAYVVCLAIVLLSPSARLGTDAVSLVSDLLARLGLETLAVRPRVEFAENVGLLLPVSFIGSLVWERFTWRDWTALGFVASAVVESLQALLLDGRSATFSDVVANTLGATLGALTIRLVRRRSRR